jgi:hypothetical protein
MKHFRKIAIIVSGLLFMAHSAVYAMGSFALDGTDYDVVAYCINDAGDYCSQGNVIQDRFIFEDDTFAVGSFDDGILGVGGSGSFNERGRSFSANYEVIADDSLDQYIFDVTGSLLFNTFMIGQMNISYYQLGLGGYDKQEESKAYFFGSNM